MEELTLVRQPEYYDRFECIGGECEDTCCAGWKITFDTETYKKYRHVTDLKMRSHLLERIENLEDDPVKPPDYAAKLKGHRCTLLLKNDLCWIHRNLGPDYLSDTCFFYPRVLKNVEGIFERSMKPSCPEVARMILKNPDGMRIVERPFNPGSREPLFERLQFEENGKTFQALRSFSMEVVRDRRFTLEVRLFALGIFMQKVDHAASKNRYAKIPRLIAQFREWMSTGECRTQFQELPSAPQMHLQCFGDIVRGADAGVLNNRFILCYEEFQNAIGISPDRTMGEIVTDYKAAYAAVYKPMIPKLEYMLENYLVNYIFSSVFPVIGDKSPYRVYSRLVIRFLLVRTILIGMAAHANGLTEEMIIRLVSATSKRVEHNPALISKSLNALEEEDHGSLAHLALFLHLPE